jgi:hypothetical protein
MKLHFQPGIVLTIYYSFIRLIKAQEASEHFDNLKDLSNNAKFFIKISVESLKQMKGRHYMFICIIVEHYETKFQKELSLTSIFGTNIVENFFGIIRSKWRYLNYWEYCIVENRAWMELVKKFAVDRPFPLKDKNIHKTQCYNNQIGISFAMEDIQFGCSKNSPVCM